MTSEDTEASLTRDATLGGPQQLLWQLFRKQRGTPLKLRTSTSEEAFTIEEPIFSGQSSSVPSACSITFIEFHILGLT